MADISIIQLSDNTEYNIKDAVARNNLAENFSSTSTYEVGDVVLYQGYLYQCTTAIVTAGEWDVNDWTLVKMADVAGNNTSLIDAINNPTYTTTEGTDLSIDNTRVGKMKFEYYGDTEQETTTGKNLTDGVFRQGIAAGTDSTVRLFSDNSTLLTNGETYTVSTNLDTTIFNYALVGSLTQYPSNAVVSIGTWNSTSSYSFTLTNNYYLGITIKRINEGAITPSDVANYWFQLEKDSTATPYEPYTGGIASPNPSYPQEVKTVTGENTITIENEDGTQSQSYEINLGANVVDCSEFNTTTSGGITVTPYWNESGLLFMKSSGTYSSTGYFNIANNIKLQPNIKYTINKSNYSGVQYRLREYDANDTQLSETFAGQSDVIITSNSNVHHAVLQIVFYTTVTALFYPQITKGTTAKKYQPYFTPIELCDIEEHQDYIHDNGGKWFKHKEVGKVILDSNKRDGGGTTGTNAYYIRTNIYGLNDNTLPLSCSNMFQPCSFNDRTNGLDITYLQNGQLNIRTANNTTIDWSDNTKRDDWLNANKPIVYYVLATPTEEEITEPTLINQLNAIKYGAESYYGQTNIMITSEELQPTLKVQTLDKIV